MLTMGFSIRKTCWPACGKRMVSLAGANAMGGCIGGMLGLLLIGGMLGLLLTGRALKDEDPD